MLPKQVFAALLAFALQAPGLHPALHAQSAAPGKGSPIDRRTYGATTCRVEAPAPWNAGHITWIGGCKHGYAEGLGVLRNTIPGSPDELFLGRVEQGTLCSGVLDTPQGDTAGQWTAGSVTPSANDDQANRNSLLTAFADGAKAAAATAKAMARQRNPKAAHMYTRLATRLRTQMD